MSKGYDFLAVLFIIFGSMGVAFFFASIVFLLFI